MSDRAPRVESQIRELKVSGHAMSMEPGLYCVYNAPGGPSAGAGGLPGVRINAAPGVEPGRISVSTFTPDGWIGSDSAALVRVTGGSAELMVTVYQAKDSTADAPNLQVVLLSAAAPSQAEAKPAAKPQQAPAAQPQQATAQQQATPKAPADVQVVAHIYGMGDVAGRLGDWMSEPGSQRWIEGFGIAPPDGMATSDIEYQAVLGRGWLSPWSQGGQFCGSRGMSLPILGLRVRLKGEAARSHRVVLSASFVDGTQVGPVGDGEPCEAPSLAALEAFNIAFEPARSGRQQPRAAEAAPPAKTPRRAAAEPTPAQAKPPAPAAKASRATRKVEPAAPPPPPPPPSPSSPPKTGRAKPAKDVPAQAAPPKAAAAKETAKTAPKSAPRAVKRTPPTTRRR